MESKPSVRLWRARWAAIGAAVAVAIGGGGLYIARAADSSAVFVAVTPTRVLDTRSNIGLVGAFTSDVARLLDVTGNVPIAPSGTASVVPEGASGIVFNVTIVGPTANGFFSVRPGDAIGAPSTSNLNFAAGAVIPNSVSVALPTTGGNAGKINLFFHGDTPGATSHVLVDIVGYYGPTGIAGTPGPVNRISNQQIAMLRWDQDPGRAATFVVGDGGRGVAFDGSSVWVVNFDADNVSKINPATHAVTATIPVGDQPVGIAFDGTSMWVTNFNADTVSKINTTTNAVSGPFTVGDGPAGVAFDGTSIWVTNYNAGDVSKINTTTNAVSGPFTVGGGPRGVAFDGNNIWVTNSNTDSLSKINPTTNAVSGPLTVGDGPFAIAFDGTSIWVTNINDASLSKINPATNAVSGPFTVGDTPVGVAFDGTSIWVVNFMDGSVSQFNPATNTVTATVTVGSGPRGVAFDGSNIWVTNGSDDSVSKIIPF